MTHGTGTWWCQQIRWGLAFVQKHYECLVTPPSLVTMADTPM